MIYDSLILCQTQNKFDCDCDTPCLSGGLQEVRGYFGEFSPAAP